jgi:hypothetical protein
MFWSLVLPAQITFWGLTGIVLAATAYAHRNKKRVRRVFVRGLLLSILMFIPSCMGVIFVIDYFRFGVFNYPDSRSVNDHHLQTFLPEAATDITIENSNSQHLAKFKINKESLDSWHDQTWKRYGRDSTIPKNQLDVREQADVAEFTIRFLHLGWTLPSDAVLYHGPVSSRGSSYTIWFSESENTAYERVTYW